MHLYIHTQTISRRIHEKIFNSSALSCRVWGKIFFFISYYSIKNVSASSEIAFITTVKSSCWIQQQCPIVTQTFFSQRPSPTYSEFLSLSLVHRPSQILLTQILAHALFQSFSIQLLCFIFLQVSWTQFQCGSVGAPTTTKQSSGHQFSVL